MGNKLGIRSFTKSIVKNLDRLSFNIVLNSLSRNCYINIPLIEGIYEPYLSLSFIYNKIPSFPNYFCGGKSLFSIYKIITYVESANYISVIFPDNSILEFYSIDDNNLFYNSETSSRIETVKNDVGEIIGYNYFLSDNSYFYYKKDVYFPSQLHTIKGKTITLDMINNHEIVVDNERIEFNIQRNLVRQLNYYLDGILTKQTTIEYFGNKISKIKKYFNNNLIKTYVFEDNDAYLLVKYLENNESIKISFNSNNEAILIENGLIDNFDEKETLNIEYFDNRSVVTNYLNEKSVYYFSSNNLLVNESFNNRYFKSIDYINSYLLPKYIGNSVYFYENNLIDDDLTIFERFNVNLEEIIIYNSNISPLNEKYCYNIETTSEYSFITSTFSIDIDCLCTYCLSFFYKTNSILDSNNYIEVEINGISFKIDHSNYIPNEYTFYSIGFCSKKVARSITIYFRFYGNINISLSCLSFKKINYGTYYKYNSIGQLISTDKDGYFENLEYSNFKVDSIINSKNNIIFSYDIDILSSININNRTVLSFSRDGDNNIVEVSKSYPNSLKSMKETYEYFSNTRNLFSYTNTSNIKTKYDQYILNQPTKIIYSDDTYEEIFLNDRLNIYKKEFTNDGDSSANNISYFYNNSNLLQLFIYKDKEFILTYNDDNLMTSIGLNNQNIVEFSFVNGLLCTTKTNNSLLETYLYNDKDLLILKKEFLCDEGIYATYSYIYDEHNRLIKINKDNSLICEYTYDLNSNLTSFKSRNFKIDYEYLLGEVCLCKYNFGNDILNYKYGYSKNKEDNIRLIDIKNKFMDKNSYLGFFETTTRLISNFSNKNKLNSDVIFNIQMPDNRIPYFECYSDHGLSYTLDMEAYYNETSGGICFFFNIPNINNAQYLFSSFDSSSGCGIYVYIKNANVYLEVVDANNVRHNLITVTNKLVKDKWNFFALSFFNRNDGVQYPDVCEYLLNINGQNYYYHQQDPRLYVDLNANPTYNIGYLKTKTSTTNYLFGKIAFIYIGRQYYFKSNVIDEYFKIISEYINCIDLELLKENKATFYENKYLEVDLSSFDVIPLFNSLNSLNGIKPSNHEVRNFDISSKDGDFSSIFNKSDDVVERGYFASGKILTYDINLNNSGTINIDFYPYMLRERRYLFELYGSKRIGVYINKNGYIELNVNSSIVETNLKVNEQSYNSLSFSFLLSTSGESIDNYILKTRTILNGVVYFKDFATTSSFINLNLSLGRKKDASSNSHSLQSNGECYPFNGYFKMISFNDAFNELSTLNSFLNSIKILHSISYCNQMGQLIEKRVFDNNINLVHKFNYKERQNIVTNILTSHIINFGNINYLNETYSYNNIGLLSNIKNINNDKNIKYLYDMKHYLTKVIDEENNIVYEYEYDDYGNIITIKTSNNNIYTNKSLSYDSLNRLISYNGNDVIYSSVNPWLIQYINGFNLTFDDNKLTRISKNNLDYSYIYDDKGFRIKKINNNTDEIIEYFYEGNNLILETCNNYKIYYYYDENNDLIGFKYNNQKYYYIRNIFKTIEKVIDNNGNIVISYRYDPYGKVIITTKANNAPINHFLYKGYYYDNETEFYYLLNRYYYPEICRWISPDSSEYLDAESINGLNLYCYCFNNPVNYVDPDGHMPFLCALLILGAIGMVANVGSQALTDLAYGNEFKWENYLVAAGAGFLGGMCYAIPGVGSIVSAAVTSGLTTAGQMAVSGEDYDGWDYLIMTGGSAVISGLTAWGFGKLSNNMAFFKDSNFILDNFTKFATNYGGITLKPTVILQAAGQIAIRETVAGFVGAPLSGIPGYFDRVYRLNKLGLSSADSFRYAF